MDTRLGGLFGLGTKLRAYTELTEKKTRVRARDSYESRILCINRLGKGLMMGNVQAIRKLSMHSY